MKRESEKAVNALSNQKLPLRNEELARRLRQRLPYLGHFSGLFPLDQLEMRSPVLVASADGVGDKLLIAELMQRYNTIGVDLVAMVVNDLLVYGARPLFFMDYYATGHLQVERAEEIVSGILEGCRECGCQLLGGETAELPGLYVAGQFDLAGFGVGVVEKEQMVTGKELAPGDVIIGIGSSGLHNSGYLLAKQTLIDRRGGDIHFYLEELNATLGEALLQPAFIYTSMILELVRIVRIKGMAHITTGGIAAKLARILHRHVDAVVYVDTWELPPLFKLIKRTGTLSLREMFNVFNMGIGFVVVVRPEEANRTLGFCRRNGFEAYLIGSLKEGSGRASLEGIDA